MKTSSSPRSKLRQLSSVLAVAAVAAVAVALQPSLAVAHSLLLEPVPRDGSDSHKDPNGPCGIAAAPTQAKAMLAPGARQTVSWNETVNHPGCFVIDFASKADAGWVTLTTVEHANSPATPRPYSVEVTLPSEPCTDCTLRLRQIMLGADVPAGQACPPPSLAQGATYYSCANVALEGDGKGSAAKEEESGGCSLVASAPSSGCFALLTLLGATLMTRRASRLGRDVGQ